MDDITPKALLDVIWVQILDSTTGGAFANPMEIRDILGSMFWDGETPEPKTPEEKKATIAEKMESMPRPDLVNQLMELKRMARAHPQEPDGSVSGEVESPP